MQMNRRIVENIREEARRAKAIAVDKYKAGDFAEAKEFAVKAQKLNPALCGLLRLNALLDVRMGFAKKIIGEVDWYAVLSVDPTADLETIQERYRKLYLDISLDSDNSVGSIDEANMLLADSWYNLCNQERKQLYDKRRQEQLRLQNLRSNFFGTNSSSSSSGGSSFWTLCRACSMKYEYPIICKDHRIMCVRCCKPFEAFECPAPSMNHVILRRARARTSQVPRLACIPVVLSTVPKPILTSQSNIVNRFSEEKTQVKVEEKAQVKIEPKTEVKVEPKTEVKVEPEVEVKVEPKVEVKVEQPPSRVSSPANQLRVASGGESKRKGPPPSTNVLHVPQIRRIREDAGIRRDRLELTPSMVQRALVEKGLSAIKLFLESTSQKNNVGSAAVATKAPQDLKKCNAAKRVKMESNNSDDMVMEEEHDVVIMSVPDADFYNFDKDQTEASFGENQVWAAYDDYGMPRFYALVHSIVSQEPFKFCMSWLNSKNNEELGTIKWIDSGFYKTSGRFSIGKRVNEESINAFSHRVKWTKGEEGFVHIYPKKGDVWALYKNWSPSWNSSTAEEVVNKYEMVEVLQDFDEEGGGVTVAPLVKVVGFKTVFRRHPKQRTFQRKELFRFSHQVPCHILTSEDGENAPDGCLELDPAALSPELLKVFTKEEVRELEDMVIKKPKEDA